MQPRPFVFVNMAMTADGKIDTVERSGAHISGRADSARVDRLRAGSDATMVGGRTVVSEDPWLTVRDPRLIAHRAAIGLHLVETGISEDDDVILRYRVGEATER